ncbi:nucleolar protein 12-like [Varroa jacobsoni]|uniref:nucleolar protein 12-like n=1 Tax=Varroa jacobsoni TaxID=62625 RepID=UPI000BF9767F|nr:nucleolar protein 12-like [Varroa jacobsoni]XP_022688992.1 nucleolar protein 12-like [Varroa jacobsoni]
MGKSKQQRKKEKKIVLMFDENERREFLSGFSKRKKERQRKAKKKTLGRLEGQRKKLLEEKRTIIADIVREGGIKLQDPQNLETLAGQSETIDCGEHTVTITELDDAYSAVQNLGVDAECDNSNEDDMDFGDSAGITNETQTIAGGSVSDQRKIRLKQISEELKDFSVQIQPIKAALNKRAKKRNKRKQKAQELKEQEARQSKSRRRKAGASQVKNSKSSMVGIKRKKINKHIIKD